MSKEMKTEKSEKSNRSQKTEWLMSNATLMSKR